MAKKQQRKPDSFKVIVRRQQKRKDGKRVYYYYNATDKKRATKEDYYTNEDLKKYYKKKYGKEWKVRFISEVRRFKKDEKIQKKKQKILDAEEIKQYREDTGFITQKGEVSKRKFNGYVNQSVNSFVSDVLLENHPTTKHVLIKFRNSFFAPTEKNLLEFILFTNDIMGWYFEEVDKRCSKKELSNASPFIIFKSYTYINEVYPNLEVLDLNLTIASENKKGLDDILQNEIIPYFKEKYFSGFKGVNINTYINEKLK